MKGWFYPGQVLTGITESFRESCQFIPNYSKNLVNNWKQESSSNLTEKQIQTLKWTCNKEENF